METKHILWAVLVAAIWGVNFVVIRIGLDDFPPILLNALRFAATGVLFAWFIPRPNIPFAYVVGVGLVLGVAKFSLLFIGMDLGMPAGLASLVLQAQAFFTVIFAAIFLQERPKLEQYLGIPIALAGLLLIALDLGQGGVVSAFMMVIAAAACWGVANIIIKKSHADSMLGLFVWASLVAAVPLFALSWMFEDTDKIVYALTHINLKGVATIGYLVVASTLIGFGLWGKLLKLYPASMVAPFSLLVPAFGLTSAAIVLGESLSLTKATGSVLIIVGLVVNVGLWKRFRRN
ncbi:MAG: EamA family transporter [Rhodospirillaceae bacterium]|nr:MAG: EamA family transporter [Rhodospirillaceae bacterium]